MIAAAGHTVGWAAGGGLAALGLLYGWWRGVRFYRLLKDLPTVRIRGIFVGLVETTGRVTCPEPLYGGISGTPCVHHAWSVSEHWRRQETYRDSQGKTRTRTVHGSDIVASGSGSLDFILEDETGTIPVRVHRADWRTRRTVCTTVGRDDPLYHSKAPGASVRGSTGLRTFVEHVVGVEDEVYCVGTAAIAATGNMLELVRDPEEDDLLLVSTQPEQHVARTHLWWGLTAFVLGLVIAVGSGAMAQIPPAPWSGAMLGGSLYLLAAALLWMIIMRNGVVRVRTRWQRAVSLVDVQLHRRADLIPNLTAVTAAMAGHERRVQEAMAQLRAGVPAQEALRVLVEACPALTADQAFLKLQQELTTTEDRIAMARHFELESRAAFTNRLQTFPEGLVARVLGVGAPPA